jgi:hypothetical protein
VRGKSATSQPTISLGTEAARGEAHYLW